MRESKNTAGTAYVSEVIIDLCLDGNRWNFLRALLNPRVAHIRLRQHSAAIFLNPPPDVPRWEVEARDAQL